VVMRRPRAPGNLLEDFVYPFGITYGVFVTTPHHVAQMGLASTARHVARHQSVVHAAPGDRSGSAYEGAVG